MASASAAPSITRVAPKGNPDVPGPISKMNPLRPSPDSADDDPGDAPKEPRLLGSAAERHVIELEGGSSAGNRLSGETRRPQIALLVAGRDSAAHGGSGACLPSLLLPSQQ